MGSGEVDLLSDLAVESSQEGGPEEEKRDNCRGGQHPHVWSVELELELELESGPLV